MFAKFNQINVKYGAAFIGVALALLVVVTANAMLVHTVKNRMVEVAEVFNQALSLTLNADRDLYQARIAEMSYLATVPETAEAEANRRTFEENADQARDRLKKVAELLAPYTDTGEQLDRFQALYGTWREDATQVFTLYDDQDIGGAMDQLGGDSLSAFQALRGFYDETGQAVDARVQALEEETLAQVARQQTLVIGFAVVVGLMAVAVALIGPHLMSKAIRQVSQRIREITQGDGDLTARIDSHRRDEIGELAAEFNAFIDRIDTTLQSVRDNALGVNRASDEIAQGSQDLASRTEQSAANLQQTSASMEQITTTVRNTSDAARQAEGMAQSTVDVARRGQEAMREVETTMEEISDASAKINEIIAMIDGIAFQTNILALNASVEAARAGEHGKGFAVVAQEVRTLAGRSGDASREIRELVDRSVTSTQNGAGLVKNAGRTMEEIVESIDKVTRVISDISTGAQEQSQGIGQVNTAVTELDTMTQHNASLVEETSAAAESMRQQAAALARLIAGFRLSDGAPAGGDRESAVPTLRAVPSDRSAGGGDLAA
ncbi:methyl-accepting chemotaxis protein [Alloalcanivorax profundimaris]|uniref:methyl-accepting chemotaxis protein n=1 Tax=Alloalcanivorax profundimaris TaxID=2735259 RepID=UPI001887DFB1|nr:methyl-accepting chemotaxis protein [Alloalcanivorax profundimaris]MBF1802373.1 HAMP domain-containing protein [Alloalcanivorax profundimaris]MCQ6260864.1 methyl-accepting chemotaxis protein [Alcanivorax sp. MM125-6]